MTTSDQEYGQAGWDIGLNFDSAENLAGQLESLPLPKYVSKTSRMLGRGEVQRLAIRTHGNSGVIFINGQSAPLALTAKTINDPALRNPLIRIGLMTPDKSQDPAVILFVGCLAANGKDGSDLLISLSKLWPNRKVVGFITIGYTAIDDAERKGERCTEPGMRDTDVQSPGGQMPPPKSFGTTSRNGLGQVTNPLAPRSLTTVRLFLESNGIDTRVAGSNPRRETQGHRPLANFRKENAMAKDNSTNDSGSFKSTQKLDLSSPSGFSQSIEWISNHVLSQSEDSVLELDLLLAAKTKEYPERRARIFMYLESGYVIGFRGKDAVYLLKGANFEPQLRKARLIGDDEKPQPFPIGMSHASLGTFYSVTGVTGKKARSFVLADLRDAGKLSRYWKGGDVTIPDVGKALSLLVCMTAESARLQIVELAFSKLYDNYPATPDLAIQECSKASRIVAAANIFHDYRLADRVERLRNRAVEMEDELDRMHSALGKSEETKDRKALITQAFALTRPQQTDRLANSAKRIREIASELGFTRSAEAGELAEIVALGLVKDAVRAATLGVRVAPKWPTRPITKG